MASAEQATRGLTLPPIVESFNKLTPQQRLLGMVGAALLVALLIAAWLWTREPAYSVLFSNLSEKDGGDIVNVLQQQNIPYKINDNGSAILVPGTIVHDTRLKLASQGLPKGGLVGFEVMENQKLGISQFAEQINYQRALEGELSRSVQSIAAVRAARVHLAIPRQTAFLRDEQKPSASVLVALYPGRVLEAGQVAGIVHLVSSSVPELNPLNISVIDQDGNLISQKPSALADAGLDPGQLKYVRDIESNYAKRIEEIVGTMVGASNVKARVTADIDFSQSDQVAETYKPNPAPEGAIRSQQTAETGSVNPSAQGVPGALTNQPPAPATAPITTPNVATGGTGAAAGSPQPFTKNATINYELDKTIRHTKGVPGEIRRLSVAVVVNNKPDAKGKPAPLATAEIKQINDLAREAMGFNQQRGDTLNVVNASFSPQEKDAIPDLPVWKDPDNLVFVKEAVKYLLIGLAALFLWRKLLKPTLDRMAAASKSEQDAAGAGMMTEDGQIVFHDPQAAFERKVADTKDIAKQDPKLVASVIKEWVGGNEPR